MSDNIVQICVDINRSGREMALRLSAAMEPLRVALCNLADAMRAEYDAAGAPLGASDDDMYRWYRLRSTIEQFARDREERDWWERGLAELRVHLREHDAVPLAGCNLCATREYNRQLSRERGEA